MLRAKQTGIYLVSYSKLEQLCFHCQGRESDQCEQGKPLAAVAC